MKYACNACISETPWESLLRLIIDSRLSVSLTAVVFPCRPLGALVQCRSTAAPGERLRLPPLPSDPRRVPFAPETLLRPAGGELAPPRPRPRHRNTSRTPPQQEVSELAADGRQSWIVVDSCADGFFPCVIDFLSGVQCQKSGFTI